jgi:hypothetical protein
MTLLEIKDDFDIAKVKDIKSSGLSSNGTLTRKGKYLMRDQLGAQNIIEQYM